MIVPAIGNEAAQACCLVRVCAGTRPGCHGAGGVRRYSAPMPPAPDPDLPCGDDPQPGDVTGLDHPRATARDRRWFLTAGALVAAAVACGRTGSGSGDAAGVSPADTNATAGTTAGSVAGTTSTTGSPGSQPASTTTAAPVNTSTTTPATTTTKGSPPTTKAATTVRFITNGDRGAPKVALTFHTSGDLQQVRSILDIVEDRGVPITAFVVGNWLDANPSMGERLVKGGHEVANHTYTHPTFERLSPAAMATEITKCRAVLARNADGGGGNWFRLSGTDDGTAPPSTAAMQAAGEAGYRGVIGFDVDPFDYKDPGSKTVVDRTLATVQPGSIISLHMGHPGTIEAMPAILDGLQSRDLRPVTLATLIG
jgi:peptidoglycan/xylan/chitin deacetylase (PgdA/CDA1 family)